MWRTVSWEEGWCSRAAQPAAQEPPVRLFGMGHGAGAHWTTQPLLSATGCSLVRAPLLSHRSIRSYDEDCVIGKAFGWGDMPHSSIPYSTSLPSLTRGRAVPYGIHTISSGDLAKRTGKPKIIFKEIKCSMTAAGRQTLGIISNSREVPPLLSWTGQATNTTALGKTKALLGSRSLLWTTKATLHLHTYCERSGLCLQLQCAGPVTHNPPYRLTQKTEFLHSNQIFHHTLFVCLFLFCLKEHVTL